MKGDSMRFSASIRHEFVLFVSAVVLTALSTALADERTPASQKQEKAPDIGAPTKEDLADPRMIFIKSVLSRYTVQVGDRNDVAKVSEPCLRWSNPVSDIRDGALAVFTFGGGRPVAVGTFFHQGQKEWCTEFSIIAPDNVSVLESGRLFWKPSEYVCKFTDLPDSPIPAAKAPLRLVQMRKIAADFSAVVHFGFTRPEITPHNLRLLAQPVYRYSEAEKILDGGLFIFAIGTDPDVNLLIEAYQDDKGARYRYALAPLTIFELQVRYKGTEVWSIERRMIFGTNCTKFYARTYSPLPGETVPE
jgi:hypothetical protein